MEAEKRQNWCLLLQVNKLVANFRDSKRGGTGEAAERSFLEDE